MFETVVIATDGSESVHRAVDVGADFAARCDAEVHAVYVIDTAEVADFPASVQGELTTAHEAAGEEALRVVEAAIDTPDRLTTAVESGPPATAIVDYATAVDADVVAMGTRGRHGEHGALLGSVAEAVVRRSPVPVLTVRQLASN